MKNTFISIRWSRKLMIILSPIFIGCSEISFHQSHTKIRQEDPIQMIDVPLYKLGTCQPGEQISSCLLCEGQTPPPPPPPLLSKAEKLAQILSFGCAIKNQSDPANAPAPSLQDLRQKLAACTSELYPETPLNAHSKRTIERLMDIDEKKFHQQIFQDLYYHPPFTDHFESYFGIDIREARQVVCFQNESLMGDLITTEYARECLYSENPWGCSSSVIQRWQAVNQIRDQLKNCLNLSATPSPITPPPPSTQCDLRSYEGTMDDGGLVFVQELLQAGYKISVEDSLTCQQITDPLAASEIGGLVKIVGYLCPSANE